MSDDAPVPAPQPASPLARRPPWRRAVRLAGIVVATVIVTAAACFVGVAALWRSEAGTRWLLRHLPGITAVDVQGAIGGGDLRVGSLRSVQAGAQVDVAGLRVRGLELRLRPYPGAWLGVHIVDWEAASVRVTLTPDAAKKGPAAAPHTLRSPVALDVDHLHIGALTIGDSAPLRDVDGTIALAADEGAAHRVDRLSFAWERLQAQGRLRAQTDAPLQIDLALEARDAVDPTAPPPPAALSSGAAGAAPLPHWAASATLRGPLASLELAASLRGDALAGSGRAGPHADVSAHVTPFGALPVSGVNVHTDELDLSAISARAPATRLSGDVRIATTKPAALDADLRNLAPAPFSANGLPFSGLSAKLEAPWSGESISVPSMRLELNDGQATAGALRMQGRWAGPRADVQLDLDEVQLARLDARLGAWRVSGPLRAEFENLPAPQTLWSSAPAASQPGAASAPHAGASPPRVGAIANAASAVVTGALPAPAWTVHLSGRLAGIAPPLTKDRNAVTPPPMSATLDAVLHADALDLKAFALQAGAATVSARGAVRRAADGIWRGDAHAAWSQLDPGAWWRLAESGPLRTGPNVLNGTIDVQLASAPAEWRGLGAIRGRVDATVAPSQLAGLPLQGKASVNATASPWTIAADLESGDNRAHADGSLDPRGLDKGLLDAVEALQASVDAPAVAAFAPLSPGRWPTAGTARFDLRLDGLRGAAASLAPLGGGKAPARGARQPLVLVSHGELSAWNGSAVRLDKLEWNARASTDPAAPLSVIVNMNEVQWGTTHITQARAELAGTLAEHTLRFRVNAPVSPPAWVANLANIGNAPATRLDATLDGRWQPGVVDAPEWQGHLSQLELRASNRGAASTAALAASAALARASAAAAPSAAVPGASAASAPRRQRPPWLHVDPVDLAFSRDAAGKWQMARIGAGHATLAGLTLDWQPSFWTAPASPGASARWAFDAAVGQFAFADVMARAEPDLGWHGDLQVAAKVHAAFDGQWHVDAQVSRESGDLSVTSDLSPAGATSRPLGLTAALLAVKAEGQHWQADANVAGTQLGELVGHVRTEAASPASLPNADSPLAGEIRARVADLNVWGTWLPPGWRMGGQLRTELAFTGRVGAPQISGALTAQRFEFRNALQGVYAHDGTVDIRLDGERAEIRTFHVTGGSGTLSVTGTASLGAAPVADLQLEARQFQLLGRIDRRLVTTGTSSVQLTKDGLKVEGKLGIDEALFDVSKSGAPTLDADVDVAAYVARAPGDEYEPLEAPPPPPKPERKVDIALAVDLGEKLRVKGHGIDTLLRGALEISAPNNRLTVRGTVRAEDGQYRAYGQNLEITRGELTFVGPVDDPRLDILATRPNLDVVVGVAITGTALAPHVQLMSEPDMSDADKLSWLMLGRAPETLGSADTALLQQAALALFAGEDEAPSDQLMRRLGITDFSLRQQEGEGDARETVVSLGRQLSRRWYVGYERGVNETTGNWQLIYRIAQRLTVRAQSGEDNSLDVIWTWRWN